MKGDTTVAIIILGVLGMVIPILFIDSDKSDPVTITREHLIAIEELLQLRVQDANMREVILKYNSDVIEYNNNITEGMKKLLLDDR